MQWKDGVDCEGDCVDVAYLALYKVLTEERLWRKYVSHGRKAPPRAWRRRPAAVRAPKGDPRRAGWMEEIEFARGSLARIGGPTLTRLLGLISRRDGVEVEHVKREVAAERCKRYNKKTRG